MTYAEVIRSTLSKNEDTKTYPICFNELILGLACLAHHLGETLLMQDFADIEMSGIKYSGKAVKNPSTLSIMRLMMGQEIFAPRTVAYRLNWQEFIAWLLDQQIPEPDDDELNIWYDPDTLIDKWNEYAIEQQK